MGPEKKERKGRGSNAPLVRSVFQLPQIFLAQKAHSAPDMGSMGPSQESGGQQLTVRLWGVAHDARASTTRCS